LINSRLLRSGASIVGLSREDRDVLRDVGVDYVKSPKPAHGPTGNPA
jgi:hypothetical protein